MDWLEGVDHHPVLGVTGWSPLPPDQRPPFSTLNLGVRDRLPDGDCDLYLTEDRSLMAVTPGEGPWRVAGRGREVTLSELERLYADAHPGSDLVRDLDGYGIALPPRLSTTRWRPRSRFVDSSGSSVLSPYLFDAVTAAHVRARELPDELQDEGLRIDSGFVRSNNINDVIHVVDSDGREMYLKTEENPAAVRAEILCSAIWAGMQWRGLGSRVSTTDDGSVLVIPPVGDSLVRNRGSFQEHFRLRCPPETVSTIKASRAQTILRVGLKDLMLEDEDDVIRFLLLNAIWGNTDRHRGNIHYGWRSDPSTPQGGWGHLLPIDHGRCFHNNLGVEKSSIYGSPIEAVTGALSNPHQLLRAFAERVRKEPDTALTCANTWMNQVSRLISEMESAAGWQDYRRELRAAADRTDQIAATLPEFIRACVEVVS